MIPTYHRIAYEGFAVANPVELDRILAVLAQAGLPSGAVALDIGAGAGGVSVAMAKAHDLTVHAIERDPAMARMIADRVAAASLADRVQVVVENSATVLDRLSPVDLIVALGTTEAAGEGVRDPAGILRGLTRHLRVPGYILWGDLFWKGDPPAPLRQIIGLIGDYATDEGWRAAGREAGLDCVASEVSSDAAWDAFFGGADSKVRAWLAAHPDAPEANGIRARADQIRTTFDFGRPYLGFGLYLFRKGD
ncbi:methyltransferase [Brevundimonas sp. AJA228-03]|uniref:SAM-dependent methyltransferase n=1 Tax=Brevundimonas sp. AJA228-03 TaxID=2752515 RepID=UPI001ADED7C4|nr:class I SAM-dependent methyltransferase [Brevundimonas sp. AJA228-03]QTN19673.1 methyltransferase [Brevundimonas sp. AJA228-03]